MVKLLKESPIDKSQYPILFDWDSKRRNNYQKYEDLI